MDGVLLSTSIKGCVPLGKSLQSEHSKITYPAKFDPHPLLAMERKLVHENMAPDWRPTDATRKTHFYESLDPDFFSAVHVRHPMPFDITGVTFAELSNLVTNIYIGWKQQQERDAEQGASDKTALQAVSVDTIGNSKMDFEKFARVTPQRLTAIEAFLKAAHGNTCAADKYADSFAQACAACVAPVVLISAGDAPDFDVFAYGFAVGNSLSDEDDFDT
ncbi:hypothetical protein CYMTET_3829 [Cymbomonas tetramitiformis]|uniref:Uncharacterized protein n=1 Tax=Cymbomonas tetramitiformis TaxID=36881 RepID=A0AAE0C6D3_9CHLO|nr:hypothetical protein CYMTET_41312 [Cymbomonas tetramitiformis]KAK3288706.1 hypothetical protein CYMTET_3829 [Cymbomonas tetramitiformis]